jgi:hypothetical protein
MNEPLPPLPSGPGPTGEPPRPPSRGAGRAIGCFFILAGLVGIAIGKTYQVNHIPAPVLGGIALVCGIYFFIRPSSRLVSGTIDNMKRRRRW